MSRSQSSDWMSESPLPVVFSPVYRAVKSRYILVRQVEYQLQSARLSHGCDKSEISAWVQQPKT